ncbi:MAG: metallophosphoesterase [Acidobacteriota bacterium]|nr:metallophosphoesterase [Acidobacteriota bacterium]
MISRKSFLRTAVGAASLGLRPFAFASTDPAKFHFALIADTHIIDSYYKGPESNPEDTESMFRTAERLESARALINSLRPQMEKVFLIGDYFHNYPSPDIDFYFQHETRLDRAKALTDKFDMPVHAGFGNHDYAAQGMSRENSHELFRRKFGLKPYYTVEHRGWKFIHLNNFLGDTWKNGDPKFKPSVGSLGEEQLNWFEAELRENKPSFVFIHYPLSIVAAAEVRDYGVHALIKKHKDSIQRVVSGHWHRWFEFGRSYGPQHLVMAATRYDPNAYLIVEADTKTVSHELLNIGLVDWNTHYSQPYKG